MSLENCEITPKDLWMIKEKYSDSELLLNAIRGPLFNGMELDPTTVDFRYTSGKELVEVLIARKFVTYLNKEIVDILVSLA